MMVVGPTEVLQLDAGFEQRLLSDYTHTHKTVTVTEEGNGSHAKKDALVQKNYGSINSVKKAELPNIMLYLCQLLEV